MSILTFYGLITVFWLTCNVQCHYSLYIGLRGLVRDTGRTFLQEKQGNNIKMYIKHQIRIPQQI